MIFSFINSCAPRRRAIVAATLLAVFGCTRSGDVAGTGRAAAPTSTPGAAAGAAVGVAGQYRVANTTGPARPIFARQNGGLVAVPPVPGAVYLGVLLRERRTKLLLPAARITATLERDGRGTDVALAELWGDFHQYGANVTLPDDGPLTITVRASPPAYARHGDMLTHFVSPVTVTLAARVQQGSLRFDAHPVQPVDADYAIGDDVLQARTEAGTLYDAGPYRVGLIVEGPEPIWLWRDGAPVLSPVAADATNHVEVALLDRETEQLVPD